MGWCENGSEANALIDQGLVKVNGIPELRKRNKIMPGMVVALDEESVVIE